MPTLTDIESLATDLDSSSSELVILEVIQKAIAMDADKTDMARLVKGIVEVTELGTRDVKKIVSAAHVSNFEDRRAAESATALAVSGANEILIVSKASSDAMNEASLLGLKAMNRKKPRLFHYVEEFVAIRDDSTGRAKITPLTRQGALSNIIHDLGIFHKEIGNGDKSKTIRTYPPKETVSYIYELPKSIIALPLRGLKTRPFFGKSGKLVHENGYEPISKMVLAMPVDAELADRVSHHWEPTPDEVHQALDLLADLVGDFALDSMSRNELTAALQQGDKTHSFATLIAIPIAGMAREMIDGPTPAYFLAKPTPGTGASLLTEIVTMILTGMPAPSQALPEKNEELSKTISSILFENREVAFFDNINHSLDSGEFASILTKRVHGARVLGQSRIIDVEVQNLWILNGNNVTMSGELLRRSVPVFLDTKMAKPTEGRVFKYPNIKRHVETHRWEFVSAILTLIQNWIAKGCPEPSVKPIASYEDWTRVVGGVLEAANVNGFLSKMDEWADAASDATDDSLVRFMTLLAEYPVGTVFRPSGSETPSDATTGIAEKGDVVSLTDVLNEAGNPESEGEPIMLNGWSYKPFLDEVTRKTTVVYSNAAQISKKMQGAARVPYKIGQGQDADTFRLEERKAKKNGARYWVRVHAGGEKPEN